MIYAGGVDVVIPIPPSANNLYTTAGHGKRVISGTYRKWLKVAVPLLMTLTKAKSYPVLAEMVVVERVAVNRDLDNMIKPILDAAKKAGVIIDDNRSCVSKISIEYRPQESGCGVFLSFKTVIAS